VRNAVFISFIRLLSLFAISLSSSQVSWAGANSNLSCDDLLSNVHPTSSNARSDEETLSYLKTRYGVDSSEIQFTPKDHYPVIVRGGDESSLTPDATGLPRVDDTVVHDVIVVGGGPAGLTSALYLTDAGKEVVVLERNSAMGGLAQGSTLNGIRAGTGAAYSIGADNIDEYKVFQHIGLGAYKQKLAIHEPIDSYFLNGKMYHDIWDEDTLKDLPASFVVFKRGLLTLAKDHGNFDVSTAAGRQLDTMFASDWIRKMPEYVSQLTDVDSKLAYQRFLADKSLDPSDPMKDVVKLLDLYSRSALGTTTDQISAVALGNFYESEMGTRYTGSYGTGEVVGKILDRLHEPSRAVQLKTSAGVSQIVNTPDGVEVTYVQDGKQIHTKAKKLVFAASVKLAPKLITNFAAQAPEQAKAVESLRMANYAVHVMRVKGHPFRETYDLWMGQADNSKLQPTDVILGRWQDPTINGYQGMRQMESAPKDDYGVMTIYQPLGPDNVGSGFTTDQSKANAESGVDFIKSELNPYLQKKYGTQIDVDLIETNRWPLSVHIAAPGWLQKAKLFDPPVGNIHFANNNLALPEFEPALLRGKVVAGRITNELNGELKTSPTKPVTGLKKAPTRPLQPAQLGH